MERWRGEEEGRSDEESGARSGAGVAESLQRLYEALERSIAVCAALRSIVTRLDLSAALKEELRHLSLTLATLDRLLTSYIARTLSDAGVDGGQGMPENVSHALGRLRRLDAQQQRRLLKHLPPGGLTSLLFHMNAVLEDIRATLGVVAWTMSPLGRVVQWAYPAAVVAILVAVGASLRQSARGSAGGAGGAGEGVGSWASALEGLLVLPRSGGGGAGGRRRWREERTWADAVRAAGAWFSQRFGSGVPAAVVVGLFSVALYRLVADLAGPTARLRRHRDQLELLLRIWIVASDVVMRSNFKRLHPPASSGAALRDSHDSHDLHDSRDSRGAGRVRAAPSYALLIDANEPTSPPPPAPLGKRRSPRDTREPLSALPDHDHDDDRDPGDGAGDEYRDEGVGREVGEGGLELDGRPTSVRQPSVRHPGAQETGRQETSGGVAPSELEDEEDGFRALLEEASLPRGASVWATRTFALSMIKAGLDVTYASKHVDWVLRRQGWSGWSAGLVSWVSAGAYACMPAVAADRAGTILHNEADVDFIKHVWRELSNTRTRILAALLTAGVPVAVSRTERPADGRPGSSGVVPCHVLSGRPLPAGYLEAELDPSSLRDVDAQSPALLYIHGGGFIGCSFPLDYTFLAHWASVAPGPVIYPFYSLSPEARFPLALEQLTAVFLRLRRLHSRVHVFGESAGGNLAAAMCLHLLHQNLPLPDHLILLFPALNLNAAPSPSRALHLNDPLVPIRLLRRLAASYVPVDAPPSFFRNPLVSPALAHDHLLARFPPTSIFVGGLDPLLDDAVDFATRLGRLHRLERFQVFRDLPHGFTNFWMVDSTVSKALDTIRASCFATPTL
jgi:acetyl esterase/lipase